MKPRFRDLETLSNSDEEIHPNIDTKSYRKFIKDLRATRLEELRSKASLTAEEQKELDELEYKSLPVDEEVSEDSFRVSKDDSDEDYTDDLILIFHNNNPSYFLWHVQRKCVKLEKFEELVYLNLSEAIKNGDDEWGLELCKMGLMSRWVREFGPGYLMMFNSKSSQKKLDAAVQEHYRASRGLILGMQKK